MNMNIQALVDGMNAQQQRERAASQMTLGGLIERLEGMDSKTEIKGLGDLESYRGYYSDLAFEPTTETKPAKQLLKECRAAMGMVFEGYKGGEFVMGALTPLWVAEYGCCGEKLISISESGEIITEKDEW